MRQQQEGRTKACSNRTWLSAVLGLAAGAIVGVLAVGVAGATVGGRAANERPTAVLEATHVPPLLIVGEQAAELRYDAYCITADESEESCRISGEVYIRQRDRGGFQVLPLALDQSADEGRYVARVPPRIASSPSGFTYYAVLRDELHNVQTVLPAAGAGSPQRSLPLGDSALVDLGAHAFGRPRVPTERVVRAAWGNGPDEVGLEKGRNLIPIGGTAFDVNDAGTVSVLDEAHRRLLRWTGSDAEPTPVALAIDGTLADMAVDDEGAIYILESGGGSASERLLRIFGPDGAPRARGPVAERADQLRLGPEGTVVLAQPSGQWISTTANGRLLTPASQHLSGRPGRPVRGGRGTEVVVDRVANEIRVALVGGNSVRRSWRVTSETPLAEVQLAEPVGSRLVLVARVYTDREDEFVVLVLGARGVEESFSLESADWAETAPLSRFRVAGSSLYQLGSTPMGLFVDRFRLELQ